MKHTYRLIFFVGLLLVEVAVFFLLKPKVTSFHEGSDVYRKYAKSEHVGAFYIENYQLNDTLSVPVTLLRAKDSLGWEILIHDFGCFSPDDGEIYDEMRVYYQCVDKRDYSRRGVPASDDTESLIVSRIERRLCLFHVTSRREGLAVIGYYVDVQMGDRTLASE